MRLNQIQAPEGARKERRRVGRGHGSGRGKTAGRGTKGQKARTGEHIPQRFEGGQNPISMRFHLKRGRGLSMGKDIEYEIVNVARLERFEPGTVVSPEMLLDAGLIEIQGQRGTLVKVLGDGVLTRPLTVHAHKFSASAREKITAAGGSVAVLAKPWRPGVEPVFAAEEPEAAAAEAAEAPPRPEARPEAE